MIFWMEIIGFSWKLVKKRIVNNGNSIQNQLNLDFLQAGIYFVKIKSEKLEKAYKIAKN